MSFTVGLLIQIYLNDIRVVREKQIHFFQSITLVVLFDSGLKQTQRMAVRIKQHKEIPCLA